jgi:hypothetical protein
LSNPISNTFIVKSEEKPFAFNFVSQKVSTSLGENIKLEFWIVPLKELSTPVFIRLENIEGFSMQQKKVIPQWPPLKESLVINTNNDLKHTN